jgi:hypothetical protein
MLSFFPGSSASNDLADAVRSFPPVVYLLLAAVCLVVALRLLGYLRKAFMPLRALLQMASATLILAVAVGVALLLVAAAAVGVH